MPNAVLVLSVLNALLEHSAALGKLLADNPNGITNEQLDTLFAEDDVASALLRAAIERAKRTAAINQITGTDEAGRPA